MADQITLEEALELVEFEHGLEGWRVKHVQGNVQGNVWGDVWGTINWREWGFIETPKQKLRRLIEEGADKAQLLETLEQLEDSSHA